MTINVKEIDTDKPVLKPNDQNHVLVKIKAVSLNPVDAKYFIGDKVPEFLSNLSKNFMNNIGIGFDFSGEVLCDNSNSNTNKYKVGDEVYGCMPPMIGSFKEFVVAPRDQIYLKPKNLSFIQAAAIPLISITSHQALFDDRFYDIVKMAQVNPKKIQNF